MNNIVFFELLRWLQENYGEISVSDVVYRDNMCIELWCGLTRQVKLKVTACPSDNEVSLVDYTAALYSGNLDDVGDVPNITFCAYERNAIKVIETIEDMIVQHCMELLPRRMIVYQAR